jgi:autotransporter-associated beta strand protein
LTVGGNGQSTTFGGVLAGSGSLTKIGAGTLTFTATNTYAGPTDISNGTFAVNGALTGTGTVTVASGATLTGNVAVGGALVVDGTFAPGTDVGAAGIAGDLTLGSGATLALEIGGQTAGLFDTVTATGALNVAGTLTISLANAYAPVLGDAWVVASGSALAGTFQTTNVPPLGPGLAWEVNYAGSLVVVQVAAAAPTGGYDLYVSGVTNGLTGYQDDADGDGYANLLEYVTGGNATNADTTARMNGGRTNGVLALKFLRNTNATDATILVEGSYTATNGADWIAIATNAAGSWGGATNVAEGTGVSPVDVTVQDNEPTATNRFLRLRVTRP